MKKISIIIMLMIAVMASNAQFGSVIVPGGGLVSLVGDNNFIPCSYVVRTADNEIAANENVIDKVVIYDNLTGAQMYMETHKTQTNENGLVKIEIGRGTSAIGNWDNINWANAYIVNTVQVDGKTYQHEIPLSMVPVSLTAKSINKNLLENYLTENNYAKISDLPADQVAGDWNQYDPTQPDYIKNKPQFPDVYNANCPNSDFCDTYAKVEAYIEIVKAMLNN